MVIQNEYCDGGTLEKLLKEHLAANRPFRECTLITILKHLVRWHSNCFGNKAIACVFL